MLNESVKIVEETLMRVSGLAGLKKNIIIAGDEIVNSVKNGGKILLCGNGGSCSDCEHIVGELMKEFYIKRPIAQQDKQFFIDNFLEGSRIGELLQGSIPAISLASQASINSAFCNDVASDMAFAQQVFGYGREGDILIALSTSGNAKNVFNACCVAKLKKMKIICLTGKGGGNLKDVADILLDVPQKETYLVQELHLPLYHLLCRCVENEIFHK